MIKVNKKVLGVFLGVGVLFASDIDTLGINLGKSYTSYNQTNTSGTITLTNNPDKYFNSIELYTTLKPIMSFCKDNDIKPYISYTHSKNSELKHQYLLVGLNKYYNLNSTKLNLYAGILAGYGQIDWNYDPLNNSTSKNVDTNSFIGGIQLGTTYNLTEKLSLNLNSKYLLHNYETDLKKTNATTTIEHDRTASVGFGLGYRF